MKAHDFGFYGMKNIELPRRYLSLESPPVLWSPPQSWRYLGDEARVTVVMDQEAWKLPSIELLEERRLR